MTHERQLFSTETIRALALAGKARFTIRSVSTGVRFTYEVNAPSKNGSIDHDAGVRFVSVLVGGDNTSDYTYLGTVWKDGKYFNHGKKSRIDNDAPSSKAFGFFWSKVHNGSDVLPEALEFFNSGTCARCGRVLTDPKSEIYGPHCAKQVGA